MNQTKMAEKLRAAVYLRLAQQDDRIMKAQKEKVMRFTSEQGYSDITVYADNGASGLDYINRPAFTAMNEDIAASKISAVFAESNIRIGRDFIKTTCWIQSIDRKGIVFKTVDNAGDDDSLCTLNIFQAVAKQKSASPKNRGRD